MRALITGGRGFAGTWLKAHLLEQGDDVSVVDDDVDVTDRFAVESNVRDVAPEAIYHLAAVTHVGQSWSDPDRVFQVNALGTLHVLDAARHVDPLPRVLMVSSAEVYGTLNAGDLPVSESKELAPVTPYAVSKVAAEYIAIQAYLAHGLPVVRARPFNHIGPGQAAGFVVPAIAQRIVEASRSGALSIGLGNLSARRDLTDVRDIVRAYRLLVTSGQPGEVYNICSGRALSVEEVARRMFRLAGVDLDLVTDPQLARPVDVPVVWGDLSRIAGAVGWSPTIDLDQTLAEVLSEWQQ